LFLSSDEELDAVTTEGGFENGLPDLVVAFRGEEEDAEGEM
jgi:hypothetical protein